MPKTKQKIKVKVIKKQIKEVKDKSEEISELEKDVESEEFVPETSSASINPSLRQSNVSSITSETTFSPVPTVSRNEQELFSQSQIYNPSIVSSNVRRTYVSAEESARRFNPSISSAGNVDFNPQARHESFTTQELSKLRGNSDDRRYSDPVDVSKKDSKRREAWEG